ncbi:glycosyltransferase [Pseudoflavonifractor sp. MSJ-37]|uniref:MGDG synthase family glycosyltransferase n=1 Tax=Pseudoflavonifractor sp. MSJ-37 TaxID=2841531 RepID=UPI001C116DD7|nr:glycosyltransferase [Pseudoflavonifractor sp. MSJ-37]MBU5436343.1 UDP-diphospho-muramoylpentapeptide beta-N-acetylglucosaminyltransferase [Pseudoflavonifractor sp. MSJ-37]
MKILILSGRFGMGHDSAARSLRQQLQGAFPQAELRMTDFFDYALPGLSQTLYGAFRALVTYGSGLFNAYYRFTEHLPTDSRSLLDGPMLERLEVLLGEERPDAVIATHPICAGLVSRWKEEAGKDLPLITCVTDLSVHNEWIHRAVDCYLVGSREIRERLAAKGVDPARILVSGIPVKAEFRSLYRRERGMERHLLIMGGGLGLLPRKDCFYEALDALPGVRVTVLTGRNEKLYRRLAGRWPNIRAVPFTDRPWEYMERADLMLTKPGGITVFESIFAELPLLLWEPFLQQEKNNARFLLRAGLARSAPKETEECLAAVQGLLYDDAALAEMSARMRSRKRELSVAGVEQALAALVAGREGCA